MMWTWIIISFAYFVTILELGKAVPKDFGVLVAESSSEKENFCMVYFKGLSVVPEEKSKATFHILKDDTAVDWCYDHPESDSRDKVVLLYKSNCTIADQAWNIQDQGGKGVVFISPDQRVDQFQMNDTEAEGINITVAIISEKSAERLKKMRNTVTVLLFAPYVVNFDFSLLAIWVIAVITVIAGSYWSGIIRFRIYCREISALRESETEPSKRVARRANAEGSVINVSPYYIGFFVMCMGTVLMLLYFFFDYLVYLIIAVFVLASILSVHGCLEPVVLRMHGRFCKYIDVKCGNKSYKIDLREILLVAFAIAVSVCWVVIRKLKYAWILQDILGVAFCINMLKSIRLPNLKICTILLVLLFFYDIFFVFITPFLTMKGQSVMEEVATGGKSEEMLPMVLRVDYFGFDPLAVCFRQYSLLGFGDILVPGLLISYCHGYDLITNKKLYYPVTVVAYAVGLLVTFIGLFLMSAAQPALLYLVPCTLLPPIIIGWCRHELSTLWTGFKVIRPEVTQCPDVQVSADNPQYEAADESPVLPTIDGTVSKSSANIPDVTGEKKYLLQQ